MQGFLPLKSTIYHSTTGRTIKTQFVFEEWAIYSGFLNVLRRLNEGQRGVIPISLPLSQLQGAL
jgi:hypothetical protein